jgi:hypothetical protein
MEWKGIVVRRSINDRDSKLEFVFFISLLLE